LLQKPSCWIFYEFKTEEVRFGLDRASNVAVAADRAADVHLVSLGADLGRPVGALGQRAVALAGQRGDLHPAPRSQTRLRAQLPHALPLQLQQTPARFSPGETQL